MEILDTLEKAKKAVEGLEFFAVFVAGAAAFVLVRWRRYKASRPRAQIKAIQTDIEALRTLIGGLSKIVGSNSANVVGITDQLQGIVGDAERKLAILRTDHESRYARAADHETLCERVQQLDDRLWELGGGGVSRRRPAITGKRENRQHDPSG